MLYTVTPLQRIYHNQAMSSYFHLDAKNREQLQGEQKQEVCREFSIPHGLIETKYEGNRYHIQRVISTDMEDYLKEEYAPGMEYME